MPDTFPIICSVASYPEFTCVRVVAVPKDCAQFLPKEWGAEPLPSGLHIASFEVVKEGLQQKTDWQRLTDVQAILLTRGAPLDQIVNAPNVQLTPTCGVCHHKYEPTAEGFADAVACAAQGEPPKPSWFDRVVKNGVYGFVEAGVCGVSGARPVRVLGYEIQCDSTGKHTWWLCSYNYISVSVSRDIPGDECCTMAPLYAVDPLRGYDFGKYLDAEERTTHAKLWWKVATEHYGLDVKFIPEDEDHTGPMWDAIRVEVAARLAEKVLGQREEDKP